MSFELKGYEKDNMSMKSIVLCYFLGTSAFIVSVLFVSFYFDIEKGRERSLELVIQTANKDLYPFDIILDDIHFLETSPNRFRLVTHYGIKHECVERTLMVLERMID